MKQTELRNAKTLKPLDKGGDKSTLTTGLSNQNCPTAISARENVQQLEITFKD